MITHILFINVIINIFLITLTTSKLKEHGPNGLADNETTCDEFSRNARFNPYSVLDSKWMVFYYWGPLKKYPMYKFYVPGEQEAAYLKNLVDNSVKEPVNWTAKYVLMRARTNDTVLLVERNERGEYDLYDLSIYRKGHTLERFDVRIKQTSDNLYIGMMCCDSLIVTAMARLKDVPYKKHIHDAAARIGFRGSGGKSYLYQGHHWMPIPEAEDHPYWRWYEPNF